MLFIWQTSLRVRHRQEDELARLKLMRLIECQRQFGDVVEARNPANRPVAPRPPLVVEERPVTGRSKRNRR